MNSGLSSFSKILLFLVLSATSCEESPLTDGTDDALAIVAYGLASREVFLGLQSNIATSHDFLIRRDGKVIATFVMSSTDTIFADTTVVEDSSYAYDATIQYNGTIIASSNTLQIKTLPLTSSGFSWETYQFGGGDASLIGDVAIIDEDDIWVVGDIHLQDSIGQNDPTPYNAVHWNGSGWTTQRIPVRDFGGASWYYPLKNSVAFSSNDVWFVSDADLIQWNGASFVPRAFFAPSLPFDGQVISMWGTNDDNIVCGGLNGAVYFYSGGALQLLQSGTDANITDVWGVTNPFGNEEIYCPASSSFDPGDQKIIRFRENKTLTDSINWVVDRNIESLWTPKGFPIYACGDGVFENTTGTWQEVSFPITYYTECIRGSSLSDIFVAGDLGFAAHFDGATWQVLSGIPFADYYSVNVKDDLVVLVGEANGFGIVTVGHRNY